MLKSGNDHNKLEAIKTQHEAALKELQGAYSNAMGLGERKHGNQLLPQSNRKAEDYNNTLQQPLRNSVRTAEDDKDFWDGFKRGMGLKAGEELGQESIMSGRPEGLSFAAQDTPAHMAGLNGRAQPLTNPGTAVDKEGIIDRDDYDDLGDYWDAVEDALNEYLENGDAQGAAGFVLNNDIDISEMGMYLPGMAEKISGLINQEGTVVSDPTGNGAVAGENDSNTQSGGQFSSFVYGYGSDDPLTENEQEETQDNGGGGQFSSFQYGYSAGNPLNNSQTATSDWQNTCDDIADIYDSTGLIDGNGAVNPDVLEKLYSENPDLFSNLEGMYQSLGIVNVNGAVNSDRLKQIWIYSPEILMDLQLLQTAIADMKTEDLLEDNAGRTAWVDPSRFESEEDYNRYMLTTYDGLRDEEPALAEAFEENNLPRGENATRWFADLQQEIGTTAAAEFLESLDDELAANLNPDFLWEPGQTNVGYGTITVDGEDYAIVPLLYNDDYEVVDSVFCKDVEFNGARFAYTWNSGLDSEAPSIYNLVQIVYQGLDSVSSIKVQVDIIEHEGVQRAVIRYYDPLWSSLPLRAGSEIVTEKNGDIFTIYLDSQHTEEEYGYIFCSDGQTMVMPLMYPFDSVRVNGTDLTSSMRIPAEMSDELVRRVEEAMADSGIYINLP